MYRFTSNWKSVLLQMSVISASLVFSWLLRFDFHWGPSEVLRRAFPLFLGTRLLGLLAFKSMHGYWRYTGTRDLVRVSKATILGTLIFLLIERTVVTGQVFPLSVGVIELAMTAASLVAMRLLVFSIHLPGGPRPPVDTVSTRVLIVGAGFAGHMLVRELDRPGTGFFPVGFVDDDVTKTGGHVLGIRVFGVVESLPLVVAAQDIVEVFIAIPSASRKQLSHIVNLCIRANVKFRSVPSLGDIASNKKSVSSLREIDVDDLLGRDRVRLDLKPVTESLAGKSVMVTGAAGSIGSELCRQILNCGPARLVCLDQDETALFHLGQTLSATPTQEHDYAWHLCIADIADANRIRQVLLEHHVQLIFHAAAYKHVPLVEANAAEATKNNVIALWKLLEIADETGCDKFILISSDKAVNPSSFMGCTKRIGELIATTRPSTNVLSVAVRFGNVLGSQGSVVPTFKAQLARGEPLTITDPEMTRFFMTIGEAVSLVLQASVIGWNGDIFVLDMGEPIKILDLARTLIALSGKSEDDIPITYIGSRPGEKIHEELFYEDEQIIPTTIDGIRMARGRMLSWATLRMQLNQLAISLDCNTAAIRKKVREIVPEYQVCTSPEAHEEPLPFLVAATGSVSPKTNSHVN